MKQTKKEQLEQTAKELFWKYGFKKVSIDEICKKAGVSRKTFYTFFDNKNTLIIYLYGKMIDENYAVYDAIKKSNMPFSEKLEHFLTHKIEATQHLSKEFVEDLYHPDSAELLTFFNSVIDQSMKFTHDFLSDAQKSGDIDADLRLDYLMFMLHKAIELVGTDALMALFPDVETMTRQLTQTFIYGIIPPTKKQ